MLRFLGALYGHQSNFIFLSHCICIPLWRTIFPALVINFGDGYPSKSVLYFPKYQTKWWNSKSWCRFWGPQHTKLTSRTSPDWDPRCVTSCCICLAKGWNAETHRKGASRPPTRTNNICLSLAQSIRPIKGRWHWMAPVLWTLGGWVGCCREKEEWLNGSEGLPFIYSQCKRPVSLPDLTLGSLQKKHRQGNAIRQYCWDESHTHGQHSRRLIPGLMCHGP